MKMEDLSDLTVVLVHSCIINNLHDLRVCISKGKFYTCIGIQQLLLLNNRSIIYTAIERKKL